MQLAQRGAPASSSRCPGTRQVTQLRRPVTARRAAAAVATNTTGAWEALLGKKVIRSSDGAEVELPQLWKDDERAVVAFARSFGCFLCWELATQLRRDIKPILDAKGVKLYLVSVGTHARSHDFVEATGFPAENLLADPENVTYDALGLNRDLRKTFFDINTPLAFKKRMDAGKMGDIMEILGRWKPTWHPPRQDQALQQGGLFVFQGKELIWSHKDPATAAHADLEEVLGVALKGVADKAQQDCGCEAQPQSA